MYLDLLEKYKGTLKIVSYLDENKKHSPEISRMISELGIPRQSCYNALKHLEEIGLIVNTREKGMPPRVYCKFTQKGAEVARNLRKVDGTLENTIEGYKRQLDRWKGKRKSENDYNNEILPLLRKLESECFIVGKWDDAIEYGKEIVRICRIIKDQKGEAEALRKIGRIYNRRLEFRKALTNFRQSLKIYRNINDDNGLASGYYYIGGIFETKGQYSRALSFYKQCEEHAKKGGSEVEKAQAYLGIGRILAKQGSFKESVKILKKALNLFKKSNQTNEILKTYTSLGATEYYINVDEAIKWHEKCINLSNKENNIRMLGYSLSNAAGCYIIKGNIKKAKEYLDRALQIFKNLDEKAMITSIFIHNAHICRLKKQWRDSKYYLDKSMKIARTIKMPSKVAHINFYYGLLHKERGNLKKARRYLESALKLYKSLGENDLVENTKKELKGIR